MAVLRSALDGVVAGPGAMVLIKGEAGIGKTRLLDELQREAGEREFAVFRATTRELEHRRPFGAIVEALGVSEGVDERRTRIVDLLTAAPLAGTVPMGEASDVEYRIGEEFLALIDDTCACTPAAVLLDDLQWVDPSTIAFLARLGRALPERFLLVCARRPFPGPKELERVIAGLAVMGAAQIELSPLPDPMVAQLVEVAAGKRPGPRLLAHMSRAGGNPMFVLEILGALSRDGDLESDGHTIEARSDRGSVSLQLTILHSLSYLPDDVVELLRLASVLGPMFRVIDVAATAGRTTADLLEALEGAIRAGLLVNDGQSVRFRHDLIREALYEDLPASIRQAMHRDAATALVAAGAPATVAVEHLLRGGPLRDRAEIDLVRRVALGSMASAPGAAASFLEAILASPVAADQQEAIAADLAEAYYYSGQVADAIETLRSRVPSPSSRSRLMLISALLAAGRRDEAFAELQNGQTSWTSADYRARANALWSVALMETGDVPGAVEKATHAIDQARVGNDAVTLCLAMAQLGAMTSFQGRISEGLAIVREAVGVADRTPGGEGHRFHVEMFHALLATYADLLDECEQATRRGRHFAEEVGTRWNLVFYYWTAIDHCFLRGRWDDAIAEYEAGIALAEQFGTRNGLQYAHAFRAMIALHRGDLATAESSVTLAEQEFAAAGPQYGTVQMMLARSLLLEANGALAEALQIALNAWGICVFAFRCDLPFLGPHVIRMALAARDEASAAAVVEALERLSAEEPEVGIVRAAARRCAAMMSGDTPLHDEAVALYRESARNHDRAMMLAEAGAAHATVGNLVEARSLFDEAIALLSDIGAVRDVETVESKMREAGIRRGARRFPGKPKFGWASLTDTERRVALLVAEGLSNPQIAERLFVSRYTVQTHVAHILAKLAVSSRTELAACVVRETLQPDH